MTEAMKTAKALVWLYETYNDDIDKITELEKKLPFLVVAEKDYMDASNNLDEYSHRMVCEAEFVKQALYFCSYHPGADITITVENPSCGLKATAHLYDHAALVTSLVETLTYFQDEMI